MINTIISIQNTSTEVLDLTGTEWAMTIILWNESDSDITLAIWWWDAILWQWIVLAAWSQIVLDTPDTQINKIYWIAAVANKNLTVFADVATPWEILWFTNNSPTPLELKIDWIYSANCISYEISLDNWVTWEDIWNVNTYSKTLSSLIYMVKLRWVKAKIKWTPTTAIDLLAPTMSSILKDSVTQITLTLSELADVTSITKANNWWFTVFQTWTPATTYAVSAINPWVTNDKVVLTIADMTASAVPWVTVTYTSGWNGTVADEAGNLMATNAIWIDTWAF